jgi:hypothetical protein
MDVLILAAGLGSRVTKYTHNIIPKYLINIDNNTGLYHIIKYWEKYSKNIYLVINSSYNPITSFYINNLLNDYQSKIHIINYDTNDGTAYTLSYILNNNLREKNIKNLLITWCDLFPVENIDFSKLHVKDGKNNIYVFTHGNKCRYLLNENNEIIHRTECDGNILGIFYFQNYNSFILGNYCKDNDIVNYLDVIGIIKKFDINNIIDYGDEDKLLQILENNENIKKNTIFDCRYFNNITKIGEDKLFKKAITDSAKILINNEKKWYNYIKELNNENIVNLIPTIYDFFEYGFLLEYKKNHIPVYKFFMDYEKYINEPNIDINEKYIKNAEYNIIKITILKNIIDKINKLHNIEKKNISKLIFLSNLKKEIYDKIYNRKKIIEQFINYFGIIEYVNNIKIESFEKIIEKCKNIITKYYDLIDIYEYSIILGDCQFSNILINPNNINDICFIDPRGYFGDTIIHGPIEYDYAKVLYGISGYDNFNANYFNIKKFDKDNKSIEFEINGFTYDKKIINKYFNKIHKAYLVLIWLSLPEYSKNNIWKCLASYYYGLYLGTLL